MMAPTGDPVLERLSRLMHERNRVEAAIAHLIGRPAHSGHVGEFLAARIFNIELETSATSKGIDGRFREGQLAGKSVNVKFYPRNGGLLDINPSGVPDYYLVLAGPWTPPISSRGSNAPWAVANIFLFDANRLLERLRERKVKIGVATSVIRALWNEAEIYPIVRNHALTPTDQQRRLLSLFAPLE